MKPMDYLTAARVPDTIATQTFFPWEIERRAATETILGELDPSLPYGLVGWPTFTLLRRWTDHSIHQEQGEVVMEDSLRELRKHLPIWLAAHGRVLKTGLGLGCVVRGLLVNPAVEHIDVVEIDPDIVRIVGATFADEPRVTIHLADALTWDFGDRVWDFAWHDLHSFTEVHLQRMHIDLMLRYRDRVRRRQGAWAFPREVSRVMRHRLLGAPRTPRNRCSA